LSLLASSTDNLPNFEIIKDFSKQSRRESLTVDSTLKPLFTQFFKKTSVCVLGFADVTAAKTTSLPSSQRIRTGLFSMRFHW